MRVYDLSTPTDPRPETRWFDTSGKRFEIIGTWQGNLLFLSRSGLSAVRLVEDDTPSEAFCIASPGQYAWGSAQSSDSHLVLTDWSPPAHASIYTLKEGQPVAIGEINIEEESRPVLEGNLLVVSREKGGFSSYRLGDDEPERIASGGDAHYQSPVMWGGFLLRNF